MEGREMRGDTCKEGRKEWKEEEGQWTDKFRKGIEEKGGRE